MGDLSNEMEVKTPQVSFQSKELEQLLDMIDQLRAQGISRFIDLPQMIVCGDQSSGKSSVLEAVSGVRFPTKDNLCTRFPTELILRRSPNISTSISIVPDAGRNNAEKAKLQAFSAGSEALEDFGSIVDAAGELMGLDRNSKAFSNDVLRVELTGPKLPHLTLVDLPGLFHAANKNQSADDAEAVKALVMKYMQKSRSIILAVVSAKNDYANQIVTKYARDVDPSGDRTLGIITKPDTLHAGSESEKQFLELAENKDVALRLGWHVLKNRDFDTRDSSSQERDEAEAEFFEKRVWSSLSPLKLGIGSLKPRLSRVLKDQILVQLPSLIEDVKAGINDCESRLERLGASRATRQEQRMYLHLISQDFCKIIRNAVEGHYNDDYFEGETSSTDARRIRAVVSNMLERFAQTMRTSGHQYSIVETDGIDSSDDDDKPPISITRDERLERIAETIRTNRGRELPGFAKFETVTTLFKEQCQPWEPLVKSYAEQIFHKVQLAVLLALDYVSDQSTKDGVLRLVINPALDQMKTSLDERVMRNLHQHVKGQPITFNHYFTDNVQKLRNEHEAGYLEGKLRGFFACDDYYDLNDQIERTFQMQGLLTALTKSTEEDMSRFACSEALHYMEAYYKVAIKFFVDDFGIHTIEEGLLERLVTIFDSAKVFALSDEEVEDVAGETEESRMERSSSSNKLAALKDALKLLRQLDRRGSKAKSK